MAAARIISLVTLLFFLTATACCGQNQRVINRSINKLRKLDQKLPKPKEGEWLSQHREKGQSFTQYKKSRPNVLTSHRKILYIQPLGGVSADHNENESLAKIVKATQSYLGVYFQCEVKTLPALDLARIPSSARRIVNDGQQEQLLTSYILENVLKPRLPEDGFATLALTDHDLWPGDGWNFVFGYAAFRDRVGIWSFHRFGTPDDEDSFRKCLQRTIKLATHETGHMFSMPHCTNARCNMQGSNSLKESDSQPLHLCSQCQAKVLFATGADPIKRFEGLKTLCERHGFTEAKQHYEEAIELLKK